MKHLVKLLALAFLLFVAGGHAAATAGPVRVQALEAELVAERAAARPGDTLRIGLRLRHEPGWHTYWRNPGDSGLPTTLEPTLPAGWTRGDLQWPAPVRVAVGPLLNFGYEDEVVLPMSVSVPAGAAVGDVRVTAKASWLMCREVCIPGDAELDLVLPVTAAGSAAPGPSPWRSLFEAMDARMPADHVEAPVAATGATLSVMLPRADLANATFFPYREGWMDNPAVQSLYRLGDRSRLDVPLLRDASAGTLDSALAQQAIGVVVVDGRPFEVRPRRVAAVDAGGEKVWSTAAAGDRPAQHGRSQSLLDAAAAGNSQLPGPARPADASPAVADGAAAGGSASLVLAMAFALVGGLILNLMPCVFPVIGLKILGFAAHGGAAERGRAMRSHAFAFAAGIVVSFWALAGLLFVLRGAGQAAGWGFQLQSPAFVAAMALLFIVIGLNLSGVYEFGTSLTQVGGLDRAGAAGGRSASLASFGSGALAVLVATPCTAPFMGSAIGFTLGRSVVDGLLVFTALGVGMAVPYLVLGWLPRALAWLPRPGRWMESLRQFLAFPMYATAAWLAWVLGQQAGIDAVLALGLGAVLVALAAWLYGRFVQGGARFAMLASSAAAACLALGLWLAWPGPDAPPAASSSVTPGPPRSVSAGWSAWSDEAVAAAVAAGRPVLVDFTAAWCVTCQANKKLVLDRSPVTDELARRGVVRLRADWTQRDAKIGAALARHGRNGVPLYLVYAPGRPEPTVLPEVLSAGIVLDALAATAVPQASLSR